MDNYQPTHNFHPSHPGENNIGNQSTAPPHLAQHVQGVMDGSMAHPRPTQVPAANEAETAIRASETYLHERIVFNPAHTCATCKEAARSNHALEVHARERNHKAFLCICAEQFKTKFTLDRHTTEQSREKYCCNDCNDNKTFLREETFTSHLRTYHKLGEQRIAEILNLARGNPGSNLNAPVSSPAITADNALPMLTATGHHVVLGAPSAGLQDLTGYPAGPSTDLSGVFLNGAADYSMGSTAGLQPFGMDGQQMLFGTAWDSVDPNNYGTGYPGSGLPGSGCPCVGCLCAGYPGAGCLCAEFPGDRCLCAEFLSAGPSGAKVAGGDMPDVDGNLDMSWLDNI